jgi:sortase (surface protein transpeptidase)
MFERKNSAGIWRERQEKINSKFLSEPGGSSPNQMFLRTGGPSRRQNSRLKDNDTEISGGYEELKQVDVLRERKNIKSQHKAKLVVKHGGTFIFIVSLAATIIILLPFLGIGTREVAVQNKTEPTIQAESENVEAKVIKEAESLGLDARFSLYVPAIDAKSVVIENVDMGNESEYLTALKKGVAHGKGTYFPGQGKNIFLFSHSVSAPEYIKTYNAVFYDLKDLGLGDEIIIYFSGTKYVYSVFEATASPSRRLVFKPKITEVRCLFFRPAIRRGRHWEITSDSEPNL